MPSCSPDHQAPRPRPMPTRSHAPSHPSRCAHASPLELFSSAAHVRSARPPTHFLARFWVFVRLCFGFALLVRCVCLFFLCCFFRVCFLCLSLIIVRLIFVVVLSCSPPFSEVFLFSFFYLLFPYSYWFIPLSSPLSMFAPFLPSFSPRSVLFFLSALILSGSWSYCYYFYQ